MREHGGTMCALLWVALLLGTTAASFRPLEGGAGQLEKASRGDTTYRLGGEIVPVHYDIIISPQFLGGEPENFAGKVEIQALVNTSTNKITLHRADNVGIVSVNVTEEGSDESLVQPGLHPVYKRTEIYEIPLVKALHEGKKIVISIIYIAYFPDEMHGFYKKSYTFSSKNGTKRQDIVLATEFWPTHARSAFPCFDEPGLKTTFQVTLVVPQGYKALSNTPIQKTLNQTATNSLQITFDKTPKMSTYILAFIVYKEDTYGGTAIENQNFPFRTWGQISEINAGKAKLSQIEGPLIIKEMEKFTNILYTAYIMKMDQVAIPDYFGAMEHWGLITYKGSELLYDEKEHTQAARKGVSELIAHESAHQWFGNLVTTAWWDTAWLNEGFATYFEYYIINKIHPKWRMMESMVVVELSAAFSVDSSPSASTLTRDVNSPAEVTAHFDAISYRKGGCIIRMFSNILGEAKFKTAIQDYLKKNVLSTGTPAKLFEALTNAAGDVGLPNTVDLRYVLESWTVRNGYPVINVTRKDSLIIFSQEQFYADGTTGDNTYNVLINLASNDENYSQRKLWILDTDKSVTLTGPPESDKWLLVPTTGYFRVNYDENNWALLSEQLRTATLDDGRIEPLERAMLIDNALNLARTNRLKYTIAIQLLSYLRDELDYIPWSLAFSGILYIYRMLRSEGDTIDRFILHITENVYDDLGFKVANKTEDTLIEHEHRDNVLYWTCRSGHPQCIASAVEHLQNYLEKEESVKVDPELRSVVYCYGVKHMESLWPKLWMKLEETKDAFERSLLISALGCAQTSGTLYLYLETTVFGESNSIQDIVTVFSSVCSNPEGVNVTLHFLDFNLHKLQRTKTVDGLPSILIIIAQYINKQEQLDKLVNIAERLTYPEVQKAAQRSIATANANIKWLQDHKECVLRELNKIAPPAVTTPGTATTTQGAWAARPAGIAFVIAAALPAFALLH